MRKWILLLAITIAINIPCGVYLLSVGRLWGAITIGCAMMGMLFLAFVVREVRNG
jgi:hypothetical protein